MRDKLEALLASYGELTQKLGDPEVLSDQKQYTKFAKEQASMSPLAKKIEEYFEVLDGIEDAEEILRAEDDPEMKEMAKEELHRARAPEAGA